MNSIEDIRIMSIKPLPSPKEVKELYRLDQKTCRAIAGYRKTITKIISWEDNRFLAIIGPCSIHSQKEAVEYAARLKKLSDEVSDKIFIVMRAFFAKPRTTIGWKGLIYDPYLDGSCDIVEGVRLARETAKQIIELGLPIGTEVLDPFTVQYLSDCISWAGIGARTVESQLHRELASGLSAPVGFKNNTDGNILVAFDAMEAAGHQHVFLGVGDDGRIARVVTRGNPRTHIILRGAAGGENGKSATNYEKDYVQEVAAMLGKRGLSSAIVVDCSHGNSGKNHQKQAGVFFEVLKQRKSRRSHIVGAMLESYLEEGSQKITRDRSFLKRGISITDACIGWDETEKLLKKAYDLL